MNLGDRISRIPTLIAYAVAFFFVAVLVLFFLQVPHDSALNIPPGLECAYYSTPGKSSGWRCGDDLRISEPLVWVLLLIPNLVALKWLQISNEFTVGLGVMLVSQLHSALLIISVYRLVGFAMGYSTATWALPPGMLAVGLWGCRWGFRKWVRPKVKGTPP